MKGMYVLKKLTLYSFLLVFALILVGCGNSEETNKGKATEKVENENLSQEAELEENAPQEEINFEIIETVGQYGGDSFIIDDRISEYSTLYNFFVSEHSNGDVFVSFYKTYSTGTFQTVTGTANGWNSMTELWDQRKAKFRGELFFTRDETGAIVPNHVELEDATTMRSLDAFPDSDDKSYMLGDSSIGPIIIIENDEQQYTIYKANDPLTPHFQFKDEKDVLGHQSFNYIDDNPVGQKIYVDFNEERLYFMKRVSDYSKTSILDLTSGEPVFINGELKGVKSDIISRIIGDGKGHLYILERYSSGIFISAYNSDLDILIEPFYVPVANAQEFPVTYVNEELHIWGFHEYELERSLELVRVANPFK